MKVVKPKERELRAIQQQRSTLQQRLQDFYELEPLLNSETAMEVSNCESLAMVRIDA